MNLSKKEIAEIQAWARRSIDRAGRQKSALASGPLEKRVKRLRSVAESDKPVVERLQVLRELIPSEMNKAQQTLVWGHAFTLEVNSAGLSILFDRYTRGELTKFDKALEAIGAAKSRRALAAARERMKKLVASGKTWFDAAMELDEDPVYRRTVKAARTYVDEAEPRLLKYCQAHVEQLAAVPRTR